MLEPFPGGVVEPVPPPGGVVEPVPPPPGGVVLPVPPPGFVLLAVPGQVVLAVNAVERLKKPLAEPSNESPAVGSVGLVGSVGQVGFVGSVEPVGGVELPFVLGGVGLVGSVGSVVVAGGVGGVGDVGDVGVTTEFVVDATADAAAYCGCPMTELMSNARKRSEALAFRVVSLFME